MNRRFFILFIMSATFFTAFTGLIFAVKYIDVLPIGPDGSMVGLATINGAVFEFIGGKQDLLRHYRLAWNYSICRGGGVCYLRTICAKPVS